MTVQNLQPFRTVPNADIFNAIRKNASTAYQNRIPNADKGNTQDTINNLIKFRPLRNEFVDALVNRIGLEIFKFNSWSNPLSPFKRGMLENGDTIEEVITGLLEAKTYDPDRESLEGDIFGTETPEVQSSFHKINRQDFYKVTVKEALLRRAFLSEFGLSGFIGQVMEAPQTSDQWDEFLLMSSLFKLYDDASGFVNVQIGDLGNVTSNADDSRYALRRMRELAGNLQFISTKYNAAGMPISAQPSELRLFITPEADAAIDVEALAAAFNIDKADFGSRKTIIPSEHLNMPGTQAILTTDDFFVVADSLIETASAYNPAALANNYFLHHHQVVSASRFVPAIKFSTEASTPIVIEDYTVASIANPAVYDDEGNAVTTGVERGGLYQIDAAVTTNPAGGPNTAVIYSLSAANSQWTRITRTGVLAVGVDESLESLTVVATSVDDPNKTSSATFTVIGDEAVLWPNPEVLTVDSANGLVEVTPEAPTEASGTITIPTVTGVQYKNGATTLANGSTVSAAGGVTITAVARANYELAPGAVASWTFAS